MLALLVVLSVLCFQVKGEWDPDNPRNCKYLRLEDFPYDVDRCMGTQFDYGWELSLRFKCTEEGNVLYQYWEDTLQCEGSPWSSRDITDVYGWEISNFANYTSHRCEGEDCGFRYKEYMLSNDSIDPCEDYGWREWVIALDTCAWYEEERIGMVFEYSDDSLEEHLLTVNVYTNDEECRNPNLNYSYVLEDGCHEYDHTGGMEWLKYDIPSESLGPTTTERPTTSGEPTTTGYTGTYYFESEWDPDNPRECKHVTIFSTPYAVDLCLGAEISIDEYSYRYQCVDDGRTVWYEVWDNIDCRGDAIVSEDVRDEYPWLNITFSCEGQDCGAVIREYDVDSWDNTCQDYGYEEEAYAVETCTQYGDYGVLYECVDGILSESVFYDDEECRDPLYTLFYGEGCTNYAYNGTGYEKLDIMCPDLETTTTPMATRSTESASVRLSFLFSVCVLQLVFVIAVLCG